MNNQNFKILSYDLIIRVNLAMVCLLLLFLFSILS